MVSSPAARKDRRYVIGLCVVLAVSFGLRLVLVRSGGQGFWPDENRFFGVADKVGKGNWNDVLMLIMGSADHLGFKALSVIPGLLQAKSGGDAAVSAAFFALFSTASIGWIWLIARRTGAEPAEALGASLVFACSNTMFYWSRHLVPYDVALFWGLACLFVAVGRRTTVTGTLLSSALAGMLGLLTFITYNGYWTWVALVLAGHVIFALPDWKRALLRGVAGLVGLVGGFVALVGFAGNLDVHLPDSYAQFAGTITQGDFSDGHRVVWEYFWSSESICMLVWIAAAAGLIAARFAGLALAPRGWLWLGGATGIVIVLVVGSNLLEVFVVYGRVARQIVPFAALLTGYVIFGLRWPAKGLGRARIAVAATLVLGAAWNFAVPIKQEFPIDFGRRSSEEIARLRSEAERDGRPMLDPERVKLINADYLWPYPTPAPDYGKTRDLRVRPHPLSYRPYLFEGFNREQREVFLKSDIRMRLLVREP